MWRLFIAYRWLIYSLRNALHKKCCQIFDAVEEKLQEDWCLMPPSAWLLVSAICWVSIFTSDYKHFSSRQVWLASSRYPVMCFSQCQPNCVSNNCQLRFLWLRQIMRYRVLLCTWLTRTGNTDSLRLIIAYYLHAMLEDTNNTFGGQSWSECLGVWIQCKVVLDVKH